MPLTKVDVARRELGILPGVRRQHRILRQPASEGGNNDLRLQRHFGFRLRLGHHVAPVAHARLRLLQERPVRLPAQALVEAFERLAAIADEADVDRIAQPDALTVAVDLHAARLPGLRIVFDVGEGRPDDQERVTPLHRLLRRPGAEQADPAGGERMHVRQHRLAEQRLCHRRAEQVGGAFEFRPCAEGAAPREDGDARRDVQNLGGSVTDPVSGEVVLEIHREMA